jgi:GMP reductase
MKNIPSISMRFDFDDINLIPKKCVVDSRNECNTSLKFGNHTFKLPIVPANMECILDTTLAEKLTRNGYFYILHRFLTDDEIIKFVKSMNDDSLISSISLGVNQDSYELFDKLINNGSKIDFITVDIAHGHAIKMERMIKYIKENSPSTFVIAGNVSTVEAVFELEKWGADAIKVGIGPGSSCTTYPSTGFGSRNCQASTIYHCATVANVPIIADGGIKTPGDIAKSLVLGATMVMTGGLMSGYNDSPGHIVEVSGKKYKEFWGSASSFQSGKSNRIEGRKTLVEFKNESILDGLKYLEECLQSSISYGGGKDLDAFINVQWV